MAEIKQTLTGKLKQLQFKFVQSGMAEQVMNLADKWDDIYFLLQSFPIAWIFTGITVIGIIFGMIWWYRKKKKH